MGKIDCDQMEHLEGEQYSQERNPRAYMSIRDYRNLPWQNQQPLGRNQNPNRSMRDYRDQWMSAPVYSVPSTYAPHTSPHFSSTPQPQQPPTSSPVEQAILNLSKLVDNFIEEQRVVDLQANKEIDIVESSLNKELDEFQSEIDENFDILQQVQEELMQEPIEAPEELPVEEAREEPQELTLHPIPIELNPTANSHATYNPLPVALYLEPLHILLIPATQFTPERTGKTEASPSALPVHNFRKLVATIQACATTSKTLAATHVAWHSGWFGCRFGHGAPEPRHC